MSEKIEDFGPNIITVTDEDGNEIELEYIDALEYNGSTYSAFFPTSEDEDGNDEEDYGLIIMKEIVEDGETILSTLDSEEELEKVYELFMQQILEDEDEE